MDVEFFESDSFVFIGKPSNQDEHDKQLDVISELGGMVARAITKKITIVVCDDDTMTTEINKAKNLGIPVVKSSFITDCISKRQRLDTKTYLLENDNKKRKSSGDDDGNDDNEASQDDPVKRMKKSIDTHVVKDSLWCGARVSADGDVLPCYWKIDKRDGDSISGEMEWPTLDNAKSKFRGTIINENVEWEEYEAVVGEDMLGTLPIKYQATFNVPTNRPQFLAGKTVDTNNDPSTICTFKLSLTKRSPSLLNINVTTTPTNTNIPIANISSSTSTTTVPSQLKKSKSGGSKGTISVSAPPPPPPPLDLPFLKVGEEFTGNLVQSFPLTVKITSRKSEKAVEGTIEWTDFSTKTKFKGTLDGDIFKFQEYEVTSGDGVELPVDYSAKLISTLVAGDTTPTLSDDVINGDYKLESGVSGKFKLTKV